MPKLPPLGRPRFRAPPPPSLPLVAKTPTPPPIDSDHNSDHFDPNRTPPPPAAHLFRGNIPEEKRFEVQPLWRPQHQAQRPLTGKPPTPQLQTGIKRIRASGPKQKIRAGRQAASAPETAQNPLTIIQTSLQKISSYLDTLAAVQQSSRVPLPLPPQTPIPRTNQGPFTPPATLADLISSPLHSRKR